MSKKHLQKAVAAAGSQSELARQIQVSQQLIWNWLNRDKKIPSEYVLKLERVSGISRHKWRPDIYPNDM